MADVSRRGLPPGIQRRHARACPAFRSDDLEACRCRPAYQAQAGPRAARQTKTFPTLAAAKTWKRDTETAFARGERSPARAPRLRDAAEAWLAAAAAGVVYSRGDRPYKPSTLRGYRRSLEAEVYPELGDTRLDQLTRGRLNAFVQALATRGLAASTVRNAVIPLRAIYRHALDLEQVTVNPTRGIRVPGGSGRRMRFATPGEIPPLLAALDPRDRALWATAIYAGLRRGELMGLRWADIDLAAGTIRVEVSYDPTHRTTAEPKSIAGSRRVPICAALRDELVAHRQRAGARPRGLVFARGQLAGRRRGDNGALPFSAEAVTQRAHRVWNKAALRPLGLHDCRHTFASLMIAATAAAGTFNPKLLQQMLGHSSIQVTYDRYGHLFPGAEGEAAAMLDAYLEAGTRPPVAQAVTRLLEALGDAAAEDALPAVTEARDVLATWLAEQAPLPSVTPDGAAGCEHPADVQRSGRRRVQ